MNARRRGMVAFVLVALAVALSLVVVLAPHASDAPDGLTRVASEQGIQRHAAASRTAGSPLAGYEVDGVDDTAWGRRIAGVVGAIVAFGAMTIVVAGMRRRAQRPATTEVA